MYTGLGDAQTRLRNHVAPPAPSAPSAIFAQHRLPVALIAPRHANEVQECQRVGALPGIVGNFRRPRLTAKQSPVWAHDLSKAQMFFDPRSGIESDMPRTRAHEWRVGIRAFGDRVLRRGRNHQSCDLITREDVGHRHPQPIGQLLFVGCLFRWSRQIQPHRLRKRVPDRKASAPDSPTEPQLWRQIRRPESQIDPSSSPSAPDSPMGRRGGAVLVSKISWPIRKIWHPD